jgi:hypothetical protein
MEKYMNRAYLTCFVKASNTPTISVVALHRTYKLRCTMPEILNCLHNVQIKTTMFLLGGWLIATRKADHWSITRTEFIINRQVYFLKFHLVFVKSM